MAVTDTKDLSSSPQENEAGNQGLEPSPLRLLQISSLATKGQHRDNSLKFGPYREASKVHKSEKIIAKSRKSDPGFLFDIDLPEVPASSLSIDTNDAAKIQVLHLATIFLNSSKAYASKFNIIDPLKSKDLTKGANLLDRAQIKVSRSTHERAEMVKFCFELKSLWIERALEVHGSDPNYHLGLDGVYNPLQIIRNRVVRQNLHHQPPPNTYKLPPLACNAFSSHNSPGKIRWKCLWGIDLDELTFDMAWRKMYWFELRNAQGELWFPRASDEEKHKSTRLHDKLWAGSDLSGDWLERPLLHVSVKSGARKHKGKSLKERAKRLYASSYNSNSDSDGLDLSYHLPSSSDNLSKLKPGHAYRSSMGQSTERNLFERSKSSDSVTKSRRSSSRSHSSEDMKPSKTRPPLIIVGYDKNNAPQSRSNSSKVLLTNPLDGVDSEQLPSINDVNFNPGHQDKSSVVEMEYGEDSSDVATNTELEALDADEQLLLRIQAKTDYLDQLMFLDFYYMSVVHPAILKRIESRVNRVIDKDVKNLKHKISDVNYSSIPARQQLHKGFQDEIKGILRVTNEECATKTDNLLTATDRLYGELNTSLMMELRKSSKRIDKANQALFGSLISSSQTEKENSPVPMTGNYRSFYLILENLIVVMLHITWIVVTIMKFITRIVRMFLKMVSFFVC